MNRKRSSRLLPVPVQCLLIILINQLCGTFSPAKIESSALRHFPRTESNEHNEAISKQNFSEEKSSLMQKILDLYRALNRGQLRLVTELYSGFYFDIQIRNNISIENYTESQSLLSYLVYGPLSSLKPQQSDPLLLSWQLFWLLTVKLVGIVSLKSSHHLIGYTQHFFAGRDWRHGPDNRQVSSCLEN